MGMNWFLWSNTNTGIGGMLVECYVAVNWALVYVRSLCSYSLGWGYFRCSDKTFRLGANNSVQSKPHRTANQRKSSKYKHELYIHHTPVDQYLAAEHGLDQ